MNSCLTVMNRILQILYEIRKVLTVRVFMEHLS